MSNHSIHNESQESSVSDQENPAILNDIKQIQVTIQDQATDFLAVLLDRAFVKLLGGLLNDATEEEKDKIQSVKETFLEKFRYTIGQTYEEIVDPSMEDMFDRIVETSKKVIEEPDYMREICPIRSDFLGKLKGFKEEIDSSNEALSKEREVQHALLRDELKATKLAKNLLIKVSCI